MGGGTLTAKVAGKIAGDRAAGNAEFPLGGRREAPPQTAEKNLGAPRTTDAGDYTDSDAPEWLDTAGEAAYLGEQAALETAPPARAADAADAEDADDKTAGKELPAMDTLVARIPAESREILEDLFRARFVKVRKIPSKQIDA